MPPNSNARNKSFYKRTKKLARTESRSICKEKQKEEETILVTCKIIKLKTEDKNVELSSPIALRANF